MPSSKKRKTTHPHANATNRELTQAEIWDDSALIRAWNDAYAEYEYYHGIHARGEDVDEILRQAEEAEEAEYAARKVSRQDQPVQHNAPDTQQALDDVEDGEIDELQTDIAAVSNGSAGHAHVDSADSNHNQIHESLEFRTSLDRSELTARGKGTNSIADENPIAPDSVDDGLMARPGTSASDQTLENIKMAYYWAGYYSGLHDGQKQAQTRFQGDDVKHASG